MVGRTLLHYEILAQLGSGGFGRVYLALDRHTGRKVALKLLDAAPGKDSKSSGLGREARAVARLNHPGIVALHGLEQFDGEWFLVEEYVEGENLAQRLERGPLEPLGLLRLARELTAALEHAHGQGVLHRDIKPPNVLLTLGGEYKLADFGLARFVDSSRSDSAAVHGTLPYIAPERLRGHPGDVRADLFSLGAVLYEAMSGQPAFPGNTEAEIVYAVLNRTPEKLLTTSRDLQLVADVVEDLLAKEPHDRPQSAGDVGSRLAGLEVPPSPIRRGWATTVRWGIVTIVLVTIVILALRIPGPTEPRAIAVIEFRNVADSRDTSRLGLIASSLVTTNLAGLAGESVLSAERIIEATQDLGAGQQVAAQALAHKVALRTRAAWIVTGSILRTEPSLFMTAELSEAKSGRIIEAVSIEGLRNQTIFDVAVRLAGALAPALGRIGGSAPSPGVPTRPTSDLIAYQRYVEGVEYMSRGELGKAEVVFQAALKRDPAFRLAQERLLLVLWLKSARFEREEP